MTPCSDISEFRAPDCLCETCADKRLSRPVQMAQTALSRMGKDVLNQISAPGPTHADIEWGHRWVCDPDRLSGVRVERISNAEAMADTTDARPARAEAAVRVGAVMRRKGTDVEMIVERVTDDWVHCVWGESGEFRRGSFPQSEVLVRSVGCELADVTSAAKYPNACDAVVNEDIVSHLEVYTGSVSEAFKDQRRTELMGKLGIEAVWPDPPPALVLDPSFQAIYEAIKTWDINVPAVYGGYCLATGNHVYAIHRAMTALAPKDMFDASARDHAEAWANECMAKVASLEADDASLRSVIKTYEGRIEELQSYMHGLAVSLEAKDARIAELDTELAQLRTAFTAANVVPEPATKHNPSRDFGGDRRRVGG